MLLRGNTHNADKQKARHNRASLLSQIIVLVFHFQVSPHAATHC